MGPDGRVTLQHVCQVAGLGGDPEQERCRDGTFRYYVNEKIRADDPKAVGPFIFASLERERGTLSISRPCGRLVPRRLTAAPGWD